MCQLPTLAGLCLLSLATLGCRPATPQGDAAPEATSGTTLAEGAAATSPVLPGLEVLLRDSLHLVRGKRVGLITNPTAVTAEGKHAIDLLWDAPEVDLVALYGPEHGLRGGIEGGVQIGTETDERTGIPIFSLYGETQRPTPEMLRGVDVLLFDMQDIGARPYTFVWTMAMAMEAAAAQGIPFIVLDRPNPIIGVSEGPLMEMEMRNVGQPITGYFPVPLRHGMTVGEIARYINGEYDVGAELHVVPAAGWRAGQWFDDTGLPWINPSPNIRSLGAALNYSGLVLAEATNLSVGRGTDAPFSFVGAPWLDTPALLERVRAYELPGVTVDSVRLTPGGDGWVPFRDESIRAIELTVTDREAFRPVLTTLVLLHEIQALHPTEFKITNDGFTQMMGSRWAREAFERGDDPREIVARWNAELERWKPIRDRYRLYPAMQ